MPMQIVAAIVIAYITIMPIVGITIEDNDSGSMVIARFVLWPLWLVLALIKGSYLLFKRILDS